MDDIEEYAKRLRAMLARERGAVLEDAIQRVTEPTALLRLTSYVRGLDAAVSFAGDVLAEFRTEDDRAQAAGALP